ncbi:MAG: ATP-binding protein [Syntrophales bacterium]|nr:ATP-binding protein [Syntrophales bacterium]
MEHDLTKLTQGDEEALLLERSFDDFNSAAERMQEAFNSLEEQFNLIDRELERKNLELEKALRDKEEMRSYLEMILESLKNGVVVTDSEGRIQLMNGSAEKYSGLVQGEEEQPWRGRNVTQLFPTLWSGFSFTPGEVINNVRRRVNGRMLEVSSSPMTARNGEDPETIYVIRDVTRLARLEEMEKRSEKFAALEEMAATMAHEIRNPLASMELFASLLMKEPESDRSRDRAYEIIKSVRHVNNRISNLLLFTKRPSPIVKTLELHRLVDDVLAFSKPIIENENITLSVRYDESEPRIAVDAEMLKQVLLNLFLNSLQAMPDGGELGIETRLIPPGENTLDEGRLIARDVEISVTDSGEGIPREVMQRIFDPFFTTREGGAGLGLAIVHNIIDMHGGIVAADISEEGGTVMTITLPLVDFAEPVHAGKEL